MTRRILCAANEYLLNGNEYVVLGVRHWDTLMRDQISIIKRTMSESDYDYFLSTEIRGFMTTDGEFLTRLQAYKVAIENNQIIRDDGTNSEVLYSESLY